MRAAGEAHGGAPRDQPGRGPIAPWRNSTSTSSTPTSAATWRAPRSRRIARSSKTWRGPGTSLPRRAGASWKKTARPKNMIRKEQATAAKLPERFAATWSASSQAFAPGVCRTNRAALRAAFCWAKTLSLTSRGEPSRQTAGPTGASRTPTGRSGPRCQKGVDSHHVRPDASDRQTVGTHHQAGDGAARQPDRSRPDRALQERLELGRHAGANRRFVRRLRQSTGAARSRRGAAGRKVTRSASFRITTARTTSATGASTCSAASRLSTPVSPRACRARNWCCVTTWTAGRQRPAVCPASGMRSTTHARL